MPSSPKPFDRLLADSGEQGDPVVLAMAVRDALRNAEQQFTLSLLQRLLAKPWPLERVRVAADLLSQERYRFLVRRFEYFGDDERATEVSGALVYAAIETGQFFDPSTGEDVPDWEYRVAPFYVPTDGLRELTEADHGRR